METLQPYASAVEVRRRNAELDAELRALAYQVPERHLHDEFSEEAWTLAENLGHIAEFPAYFARQLNEWLDRTRVVVGRVADCDPDYSDALMRATEQRLAPLLEELEGSLAKLDEALARLTDDHLMATVHDVAHEREPLTSFLERYVIGHKAEHADQLRTWLHHAQSAD